jgi:hypothetical protein
MGTIKKRADGIACTGDEEEDMVVVDEEEND